MRRAVLGSGTNSWKWSRLVISLEAKCVAVREMKSATGGIRKNSKRKAKQNPSHQQLPLMSRFVWDSAAQCSKIRTEGWEQFRGPFPLGPSGFVDLGDEGRVGYFPHVFSDPDTLFAALKEEVLWEVKKIKLFGREVEQPRQIAYMADDSTLTYTYSRTTFQPSPYTPTVAEIKLRVEAQLKTSFNCVLLNYYRNGKDHMGWHSDNEPLFGKEPTIGSVSLGVPRAFHLRNNDNPRIRWKYLLGKGDVFVMQGGSVQKKWKHAVLADKGLEGGRINLTFRTITRPENTNKNI